MYVYIYIHTAMCVYALLSTRKTVIRNKRNVINFLEHAVFVNEEKVIRAYVGFRYFFDRNLEEKKSVWVACTVPYVR